MQNVIDDRAYKEKIYHSLMDDRGGYKNDHFLASMLTSWVMGENIFPDNLGLSRENFRHLINRHFPSFSELVSFDPGNKEQENRYDEQGDLKKLLLGYRACLDKSEYWIAEIVAAGCMGSDHLWQDLGLWSRGDLSDMLETNFPSLAQANTKNMKWKRFLYKQLCNEEGIYVCRSPSCEVCTDYQVCFGPEE